MQTPTFLRQTGQSLHIWRTTLSLFAIIIGLFMPGLVKAQGPTFYDDAANFSAQPTGSATTQISYSGTYKSGDTPYSTYTYLGTTATNPAHSNPSLGTFDLNGTSKLSFSGGSIVADPPFNKKGAALGTITAARLMYKLYLSGSTPPANYSALALNQNSTPYTSSNANNDSNGATIYENTANVDLLQNSLGGGTYIFELIFQIDLQDNSTGTITTYNDPSSTYQATFFVTAPAITPAGGTSTWQSTTAAPFNGSTDWALASNWSNGVPTAQSSAIIPEKINPNQVYPILTDNGYSYEVLDLALNGSGSTAAQLTIGAATLKVYRDLTQRGGGLSGGITGFRGGTNTALNSTLIFAGGNQLITGQVNVSDIIIAGTGIKSIINAVNPSNIIAFQPSTANGVIIQSAAYDVSGNIVTSYSLDTSGNSFVDLGSSARISTVAGQAESEFSYIKGVTKASRVAKKDTTQTFGNLGIDITPNTSPGSVTVQRVLGEALQGPAATTVPIKRRFRIESYDNSDANVTANSTLDVVFHYLFSKEELNGIKQKNLTMFSTVTNGAPYSALGGTLDSVAYTVTRTAIPSLSKITLTLGDKTNPLPVSLTAFTATRSNQNVLLAWATASEQNNAGFEVQVSTDGATFRKLAFVASKGANSSQSLSYSYTDSETGKFGTRYYRLRQLDITGEETFSPVRVVSFDGSATSAALAAYPNPFVDKVGFNLDATTLGANATAHVQLIDMTGRIVREQNLTVQNASLTLDNLDALRSGLYLARITLPDGSAKTLRVQKQ